MYFLNFYNMKKNRFLNYSLFVSFVFFANQIFSEESFIPKPPTVNASNYILIDSISGRILAESGADEKIEPASIQKLTGYIAADQIQQGFVNLDDEVYISENCWRKEDRRFIREGIAFLLRFKRVLVIQAMMQLCVRICSSLEEVSLT